MTTQAIDNPPLQRVIQLLRDWWTTPGKSMAEVRERYEAMAASLPRVENLSWAPATVGGVPAVWVTAPESEPDRVVYFLHGGAYNCGSPVAYRDFYGRVATAARACVLGLDYRLAPEHRFPAAVDDATAAYRALLDDGHDPTRIAILGDSAGGGLTLATLIALRDAKVPLPKCGVCIAPWVDLEGLGESVKTNAATDPWIKPYGIALSASLYLKGGDPRHPLAAPLYADLTGLPPLLVHAGSTEVLLDDATRIAKRAEDHGVDVTLNVYPDMLHVWHFFAGILPEAQTAIDEIGAFIRKYIP